MFKVTFPDGASVVCEKPMSAGELLKQVAPELLYSVVACHVDHYLCSLSRILDDDVLLDWVDLTSGEGIGVYQTSLSFLLTIAARHVLGRGIRVTHSISEGLFWEAAPCGDDSLPVEETDEITPEQVAAISNELQRLIDADLPMESGVVPIDKARRFFRMRGRPGKAELLGLAHADLSVECVSCDGNKDVFYSPTVPSTGYLKKFALSHLTPGMVLRFPTLTSGGELPEYKPSLQLSDVFLDYADWMRKLGVFSMVQLYSAVARDGGRELVLMSEAMHAQKIAEIADDFLSVPGRRVIFIAGPSASGKTTTSHKLRIQLQVMGRNPIALSLDDYFLDRDKCPLKADGTYDFESLEAINLKLFDEQMSALLNGEKVVLPKFDFYSGKRIDGGTLKLDKNDVLIIEGLHGLNDRILGAFPPESRYGIFLCPLTSVCLDGHSRLGTTDLRLLRRMIRDSRTRGSSPGETLAGWASVVEGAMKYIFPYQHNADAMFNSSLFYELPAMKPFAEILLRSVGEDSPVHGEAMRLLRMLHAVPMMDPRIIPSNSLLREFIGGSIIEI